MFCLFVKIYYVHVVLINPKYALYLEKESPET